MSNPLADFLAREQDELAGLDDDVVSDVPTSGADTPSQNGGLLDDLPALTGGGDSGVDLTQLDRGIGGSPARGGTNGSSPLPSYQPPKIEPEKIRNWRQEQAIRLEKKDEAEEKKKNEWRASAKKELDEWYKNRKQQLEKAHKANRIAEQELIAERDAVLPGAEWERITKLCEFNPKNAKNMKDVSRLRSMLLQLKATEKGE